MVVASNRRKWVGKKKSDSDEGEEAGEVLAAIAKNEVDR